jgi:hypothetical protein
MDEGYVMSYSIGTPPFQFYGIVDTGSDLIWSQCKPCKPCFNQTSQIFDPSKSSTYKIISCTSPTCKNVQPSKCSSDNKKRCEYKLVYGDMSHTQGYLSEETLTLTSNDESPISFSSIVIGCGHKNSLSVDGKISGIIGLGGGPLSLVSQLSSSIDRKFSYCLVPFFLNANTSSKLMFGHKAMVSGTGTVSTPLVKGIFNTFYYTNLEAFSVGDIIIKLENSTFGPNKQANTVIDSGSTLTHLPYAIYSRLESAMAAMIKLKRTNDPTHQMSLCYKTTSKMLEVPTITAHFRGADVHLKAVNTFIQIDHEVACFAFVTDKFDLGFLIFGNIAQQNFLVGFDLQKNIVSFKPTDCTKH